MKISIQDLYGGKFIIIEEGTATHQIHVDALATWGTLLGIQDPSEVLEVILSFEEKPVRPGEPNVWTEAYAALKGGLDEMSKAGVPPEHMNALLSPELGAPVPGGERLGVIKTARAVALEAVGESRRIGPRTRAAEAAIAALKGRIAVELSEHIETSRTAFLDDLSPEYRSGSVGTEGLVSAPGESLPGEAGVLA